MAGFPKPREDTAMGSTDNSFVALDIGSLTLLAAQNSDKLETSAAASPRVSLQKTLSRKGSQRAGDAVAAGGAAGTPALSVHVPVDGETAAAPHATATPPAAPGGVKGRRLAAGGRRSAAWLDPRRVLVFFATLSSMGTLILLYFTLSMGKMAGGNADAR